MHKILNHIPGFRTRTPWNMAVAGVYYGVSLLMMVESVWLSLALLSGPFVLFNAHTLGEYARHKNTKALTALLVSLALCAGSLIGFVSENGQRTEKDKINITAPAGMPSGRSAGMASGSGPASVQGLTPASELESLPLEQAVVLGYADGGFQVQYADETTGEVSLGGIEIPMETAGAAEEYISGLLPPGSIVYLDMPAEGESAGCHLWLPGPTADAGGKAPLYLLNAMLVRQGLALAGDDGPYAELLAICQEEARSDSRGLWAAAAAIAGQAPSPAPTPASTPEQPPEPTQETHPAPAPEPAADPPQNAPPEGVYYCGSKNSDVFHLSTCASAIRVIPENLVIYRSREDAMDRGKRPCKKCNP